MKADIWQRRQWVTCGFVTLGKQRKIYNQSAGAIANHNLGISTSMTGLQLLGRNNEVWIEMKAAFRAYRY